MNASMPNPAPNPLAMAALPADWPAPEQLVFGQHLAPLVVLVDHHADSGWSPLRVVRLQEARGPIASGALQYGLSVFEGLKAYRAADGSMHLFRPHAHAARLQSSAARLDLPEPGEALFLEACEWATRVHEAFLPPAGRGALYLRPTLYADEEALGFRGATRHRLAVVVTPCADPPLKTITLWAEPELTRAAPGGLGAAKTGGNYAAGLLGLRRAREQGCDDVAWLDAGSHRKLAEAGTMNLFVQIDRIWCTPPLDGTLLAGVTRDSLMALMRANDLPVTERELDLRELEALERAGRLGAAFGCGTAARVVRIAAIRGTQQTLRFHDVGQVERLRQLIKRAQEERDTATDHWRVAVPS